MKLVWFIIAILLFVIVCEAQLAPDNERFDIVLHPGEVEQKTLALKNVGDSPIHEIVNTPIGGSAKDLVVIDIPEFETLPPQEEEKVKILFVIPPETQTGNYKGYLYLLDAAPPSMPALVELNISVVDQESYGLTMTIDEAKSASTFAKADEAAEFDLVIKNLGRFRDVASIDALDFPETWSISLMDGEKEVSLPYDLPLEPNISHLLKLKIETSDPGKKESMMMGARSLGDPSKNSSVKAEVEFGKALRGYDVKIDVPPRIVINRTYQGAFMIGLDVSESIRVGIVTPPHLMVIPLAQVADVTPDKPGVANFTMLGNRLGDYVMVFKLVDSNGVLMPDEVKTIKVVEPQGMAILTSEDFIYNGVASVANQDNRSIPSFYLTGGKLTEKDRQNLLAFSKMVILGNKSVVSEDVEKSLQNIEIKRIEGNNLCELTWRFVNEIWKNGTTELVLSSPGQTEIFSAYQKARLNNLPLVICDSTMTNSTLSLLEDLRTRKKKLSKIFVAGDIGDANLKALAGMGISIEEVS